MFSHEQMTETSAQLKWPTNSTLPIAGKGLLPGAGSKSVSAETDIKDAEHNDISVR